MAEPLPLQHLLAQGRVDTCIVATREHQCMDFAGFSARASAWTAAFSAQPGQRWALYFDDTADFAAALFGAWHAGKCVYLPPDALPATVARLQKEVDGFVGDFTGVSTLAGSAPGVAAWKPLDIDAVGLVVYTSGTSGEPVAIPKRLGQLFGEVATHAGCWRVFLDDVRVYSTVSHQHIYGLLFRVLIPLSAGCQFSSERLVYPEQIAERLAQTNSILISSPAHLKRLPAGLPWDALRGKLRAVFCSGGQLPDHALQDCRTLLGLVPIEIYGSSETGGVAWRKRTSAAAMHWKLLPQVEMRLNGASAEVRSPFLPDHAWLALADNIQMEDGGFTLSGRHDRLVKIEEKRVSLKAMERSLCASPLVGEARVLLLPGARTVLGVVVVPSREGWAQYASQGKRALNAMLRDCLAGEVEACIMPRRWRYTWTLPVNPQGKTTEQALIAQFDSRHPSACLMARSDNEATLRLDIEADLPYFDGHFPQRPILPGVTQLEWAIHFGRTLFALPPNFLRMEAVKFQQIITPGASVFLILRFQAERGCLSFKLTSAAGSHAGGRIYFGAAS